MYNRVVVALDGSDAAEDVLEPAIEFARLSGATLHLVRVVDDSWMRRYGIMSLPVAAASSAEILDEEKAEARQYLSDTRSRLGSTGIPITVELRQGHAADEIRTATRPGDLLAMASHGRSGFSRFAMGSVAEEVTRKIDIPVLLCRAREMEVRSSESMAARPVTASGAAVPAR